MSCKIHLALIVMYFASFMKTSFGQYPVCDGQPADDALEAIIDCHVDRLMALRLPGWGWVNTPKVVLGLQLSKQISFFGRNETLETMKKELANEVNTTNIGKLALYAMAIQASCKNPKNFNGINVIQYIKKHLQKEWVYDGSTHIIPKSRWFKYGLAIQALCINGEVISRDEIQKMTQGFLETINTGLHSVDNTAQMVLALKCVGMRYPSAEINETISNATLYMKSQITQNGNLVWIGNKYSTPGALLALSAAAGYQQSCTWQCIKATKSIANCLKPIEPEGALSQLLPALRGKSVLSLTNSWICEETDAIPNGYQPNYDPIAGTGSSVVSTVQSPPLTTAAPVMINITLSVHTSVDSQLNDKYDHSVLVENVEQGKTLLDVMVQARNNEQFKFEIMASSYGPYAVSVMGVKSNASLRQYWSYVNATTGNFIPLGVAQYIPTSDEHILFQLKTY